MKVIRTPEECFDNLHQYAFEPNYASVPDGDGGTLRVHYIDEGPRDGAPIVFLHGNPTWSYVWRNVVPPVAAAGYRAIALDLVGLGRSDKPTELADFSVARHTEWIRAALFDALKLTDVTLVLHDWGGTMGLRVAGDNLDSIARICLANTGLFLRDPALPIQPEELIPSGPWVDFQSMVSRTPNWKHWEVMQQLNRKPIPPEVLAGYRAPYPDPRYLAGNRQLTQLLVTRADNPQLPGNWDAWVALQSFERPMVAIVTDHDPICGGGYKPFVKSVPGTQGQPHKILTGGGHFFQEDVLDEFNEALIRWLEATD